MASFDLTAVETRVLGCLLEKERLTPENYPLSLHSLAAACNQITNRDPVTAFEEKTIDAALDTLRGKKLATVVFGAGSRVQKYRHNLFDHFELTPGESALLIVLLLRGPQTPGELRARSERLYMFASLEAVESCLDGLAKDESPFVRMLPARPGQKEKRYVQLLAGEPDFTPSAVHETTPLPPSRVDVLEKEVAGLRAELQAMRDEFAQFRKQFE